MGQGLLNIRSFGLGKRSNLAKLLMVAFVKRSTCSLMFPTLSNPQMIRKYGLESRRWSGEKYSLVKVRTAPRIRMREATAVREMRGRSRLLLPPSVCSSDVTSPEVKGTVSVTVDLVEIGAGEGCCCPPPCVAVRSPLLHLKGQSA